MGRLLTATHTHTHTHCMSEREGGRGIDRKRQRERERERERGRERDIEREEKIETEKRSGNTKMHTVCFCVFFLQRNVHVSAVPLSCDPVSHRKGDFTSFRRPSKNASKPKLSLALQFISL